LRVLLWKRKKQGKGSPMEERRKKELPDKDVTKDLIGVEFDRQGTSEERELIIKYMRGPFENSC